MVPESSGCWAPQGRDSVSDLHDPGWWTLGGEALVRWEEKTFAALLEMSTWMRRGPRSKVDNAGGRTEEGDWGVQVEYFSDRWEGRDMGPELRSQKIKPGTLPARNTEPIRGLGLTLALARLKAGGEWGELIGHARCNINGGGQFHSFLN